MAKFKPGSDTEVKADEPLLEVVVDPTNPLKIGKHVFTLVVTDDAGNESAVSEVSIVVVDRDRPTAVIDVLNERGERIVAPTVEIPFGRPFTLTADKSSDVGGTVRSYRWNLQQ